MATEMGGYREYQSATATATTHDLDFDLVDDGHKIYIERLAGESDRDAADYEVVILSGGQEFPVASKTNVTSDFADTQQGKFWLYTGERLRFKWSGIQSGDKVYAWAVGVDKWEAVD